MSRESIGYFLLKMQFLDRLVELGIFCKIPQKTETDGRHPVRNILYIIEFYIVLKKGHDYRLHLLYELLEWYTLKICKKDQT